MKTLVVVLNAPKDSGKDFIANRAEELGMGCKMEFKSKLVELTKAIYSLSKESFDFYSKRENKEKSFPELGDKSIRDCLVEVSEKVIKPFYGKRFFGEVATLGLEKGNTNIFSDGGFKEEFAPIVGEVGADNVLVIQLLGVGSFEGDSRGYLNPEDFPDVAFESIQYTKDESGLADVLGAIADFQENTGYYYG